MDRRQFTWNPRSGESYPTEALMADSRTANGETASMIRTRRSLSTSASLASMPVISETLVLLEVGHSNRESTFGPGYRIYFGTDGDEVILLCGGDKSTQDADIARAKEHWKDYKRRNRAMRRANGDQKAGRRRTRRV